jgi:hypothetical protein
MLTFSREWQHAITQIDVDNVDVQEIFFPRLIHVQYTTRRTKPRDTGSSILQI